MRQPQGKAKLISLSAGASYAGLSPAKVVAAEQRGIITLERRDGGRYMSALDLNLLVRERDRIAKL